MTNRRSSLAMIAGSALALPGASVAQRSARIPRVGLVSSRRDDSGRGGAIQADFIQGMGEFGLINGRSVEIESRNSLGEPTQVREVARELAALNLDVIVALDNMAIKAVMEATSSTPIVMVIGLDPVGSGFANSIRRPGGRVTGLAWDQDPELTAKYPEFLKEAIPGMSRLGCLIDPRLPGMSLYRTALERAAARLKISVEHLDVQSVDDIERSVAALSERGAQAMFVYGSTFAHRNVSRIVGLAATHKLPDMYILRDAVTMGGMLSYGTNIPDLFRRSAGFVDKILKGASPAEMPIEFPTRYELVLNRPRTKALGLNVPRSFLLRVDEVIE